ncbi:MAG: HAMP domain-containing sensor histidine kinase [Gemmatimonadota bacterium]
MSDADHAPLSRWNKSFSAIRRSLAAARGAALTGLLILAAALIVAMVIEAWRSDRGHRATALRVLHDHAAAAAWNFRLALVASLDGGALPKLAPMLAFTDDSRTDALPALRAIAAVGAPLARCDQPAQDSLRYYFRYDADTRRLETTGAELPGVVVHGLERALNEALRAHLAQNGQVFYVPLFRMIEGRSRALAVVARSDRTGQAHQAFGFETCAGLLGPAVFERVMHGYSLLPPSLVGDASNDSVLSVNVTTAAYGDTLYSSPVQYASTFSATDSVAVLGSGLLIAVTLHPDVTDRLMVGGLPRSRLPRLLTLLGLTLTVLAIATQQVRREQELAALRGDFIASISHELRTPLTQILLFTETLRLGRARSRTERGFAIQVIHQEARRLIHLVENILTFTARQREPSPPARERIAVSAFVLDVVGSFAPLAAARQVQFRTELADSLVVQADPSALRQILLNLLENAVKFGPPGQEILIGCRRDVAGVLLWVEDQGPGIAPEHHTMIWRPFIRVRQDTNQAPGSGLGLAVVRDLVLAHQGRTWVETAESGGARFNVLLPGDVIEPGTPSFSGARPRLLRRNLVHDRSDRS